jgi:peroxiredoxin
MEVASAKGEKAWHLIVRQNGAEVSAAILRVDGDTGLLTGEYQDGQFTLSHFSGARPSLLTIAPQPDGSLEVVQNGKKLTAVRSAEARAKGLPAPDDPMQHTTMKDAGEPLRFSFPDLNGRVISNTDARFQGKVLLVAIGGSWCPNCHDEAPYLEELYRKYGTAGLEVVDLSFEEGDQLKDPARLRAFIKQYGIEYPVLIPGEPSELNAKLPQAVNLNAWPTTFFVGRDGKVRAIHTGFAGKASGELHDEMAREIETILRSLLSEEAATVLADGQPREK